MKNILLSFNSTDFFSYSIFLLPLLFTLFASLKTYGNNFEYEGKTDIGKINLPGSVEFDASKDIYKITGSGENIWGSEDAFYYVWKKAEGDLSLKTKMKFEGEGKHEHRKAGWMIRTGLEADDPYVDAVLHGDGLMSMQYRETKGGETFEVQSPIKWGDEILLERTADQFTFTIINGDKLYPAGTISVKLGSEVYAGLAVCSHDSTTVETAVFSDVEFTQIGVVEDEDRIVESTLEIIDVATGLREIVYRAKNHFEAPNWTQDGKTFYFNSDGKMYTLTFDGDTPELLNTGFADKCNNDHGLSPDGKELVISHHNEGGKSMIYVLPSSGGEPRLVTELGPSYWHGWSPDGITLVYCAERNGEYDVYSIHVDGGNETRLTEAPGLDDGPEYSPDGKYIYFNSVRTGQMKIWRMKADGSEQIQFTPDDDYGDWFAHPSPDGKLIVFVSYDKSVEGHPPNKDVVLRIMPTVGGEPKTIAVLFGGQGTINVPSWSPDNKKVAFVSYRLVSK